MVTRFGLPAMLAEGRAVTTCTAYRCEQHAYCSARSQRRPGAGDEQHGEFARVPALEAENWVDTAQ